MPNGRNCSLPLLRLALWLLLLLASPIRAEPYAEVNQLLRAGQPGDALARAEQYLAGQPRDPQMRFIRGVVLSEMGRTQEAVDVFTSLTQDHPELAEPYNNLAVIHAQQGQLDQARAALEMAIRADPGYATAHENLGDIHVRLAGQAYGRAARIAPGERLSAKLALVRELLSPPVNPR